MSNVIPFAARRPSRPQLPPPFTSHEHQAFCLARQALTRRLVEWAATGPNPADLDAELAPLPGLLDQLCQLMRPA